MRCYGQQKQHGNHPKIGRTNPKFRSIPPPPNSYVQFLFRSLKSRFNKSENRRMSARCIKHQAARRPQQRRPSGLNRNVKHLENHPVRAAPSSVCFWRKKMEVEEDSWRKKTETQFNQWRNEDSLKPHVFWWWNPHMLMVLPKLKSLLVRTDYF